MGDRGSRHPPALHDEDFQEEEDREHQHGVFTRSAARRQREREDTENSDVQMMDYDDGIEENEDVDIDEDDGEDLPAILYRLIGSGHVRLASGFHLDDDDDHIPFHSNHPAPPRDASPDLSNMQGSDLELELMSRSPNFCCRNEMSLNSCFFKREQGLVGFSKNFSLGHRQELMKKFFPNTMTVVARNQNKAFCGTFSPDGSFFLSASQDQRLRIYDCETGNYQIKKEIMARDVGWSVIDTAFSPDGCYFCYSSWSHAIHICSISPESNFHLELPLSPEAEHSFCIFSLAFSMDGREILGGANDGKLYVFDRERHERTLLIDTHDNDVNAVAFADSSSHILFSSGDDGLIKIWDRRMLSEKDPTSVGVLVGHHDGITFIDTKGDGRYLISNSKDQTIKLWDIRKLATQKALKVSKRAVARQAWDYRWQEAPRLRCSPMEGDTSVMTFRGHSVLHTLIRCRFSPGFSTGQRYIYCGCATGAIMIYDILTGQVQGRLEGHRACVRDISWHPFENRIASTSWDGKIGEWTYKPSEDELFCPLPLPARRSERIKSKIADNKCARYVPLI